jgi:hypothetical protein
VTAWYCIQLRVWTAITFCCDPVMLLWRWQIGTVQNAACKHGTTCENLKYWAFILHIYTPSRLTDHLASIMFRTLARFLCGGRYVALMAALMNFHSYSISATKDKAGDHKPTYMVLAPGTRKMTKSACEIYARQLLRQTDFD